MTERTDEPLTVRIDPALDFVYVLEPPHLDGLPHEADTAAEYVTRSWAQDEAQRCYLLVACDLAKRDSQYHRRLKEAAANGLATRINPAQMRLVIEALAIEPSHNKLTTRFRDRFYVRMHRELAARAGSDWKPADTVRAIDNSGMASPSYPSLSNLFTKLLKDVKAN